MVGLSDGFETVAIFWRFVAVEFEAIFTEDLSVDHIWLDVVGIEDFGNDLKEALEVEAVIFDGFRRTAGLDFEMLKKFFDEIRDIHSFIISKKARERTPRPFLSAIICRTCKRHG